MNKRMKEMLNDVTSGLGAVTKKANLGKTLLAGAALTLSSCNITSYNYSSHSAYPQYIHIMQTDLPYLYQTNPYLQNEIIMLQRYNCVSYSAGFMIITAPTVGYYNWGTFLGVLGYNRNYHGSRYCHDRNIYRVNTTWYNQFYQKNNSHRWGHWNSTPQYKHKQTNYYKPVYHQPPKRPQVQPQRPPQQKYIQPQYHTPGDKRVPPQKQPPSPPPRGGRR